MIAANGQVTMSPSEADQLLPWPLATLQHFADRGRLFYCGDRVRIVSRFGLSGVAGSPLLPLAAAPDGNAS